MSYILMDATSLKFEKIIDGMKNYTVEYITAALKEAGFPTPDESFIVDLNADDETIRNSINETGDVYLSWADEITVPVHGSDE